MPFTYTNRKGTTYTLFQVPVAGGRVQYTFAKQSRGQPLDELPEGFTIHENPNGIVSLAKEVPELILPEEVAAVEDAVAQHPHAHQYRVNVKPDRIEIHAKEGFDRAGPINDMIAAGLIKPSRDTKELLDFDERWTYFEPVLRVILHDRDQRSFRAEGRTWRNGIAAWRKLGPARGAGELARALVPNLGVYATFGFYAVEVATPWSDWLTWRAAYWSPQQRVKSVHRLKVTLLNLKPPIWRRLEVPSTITLAYLHEILQTALGWQNKHLHDYHVGEVGYGDPRLLKELTDQDGTKARLADVAPRPGDRLRYRYDFGDNWEHEIVVEAVGPPDPDTRYPVCLGGERAGPPEDSGGPIGYTDMLQAMADDQHPRHDDVMLWLGGPIDPEAFDLELVNRRLI